MKIKKAGHSGLVIPELEIGFDCRTDDATNIFVSHAHADHMPRNGKTKEFNLFATPNTAELMRLRGFNGNITVSDFGNTVQTPHADVTFYPAGHILGSALTLVESDLGNLLYTGDYRVPPSPASEGFHLPQSDIDHFITEATFALPVYKWATFEILNEEIRSFASQSLSNGDTPVFLAYNLGKAQEIMHILSPLKETIQIHGAGYKLCPVYEDAGFDLGNYESYDPDTCQGKILIAPSSALNSGFASHIRNKKIAYCSGWAARESSRTQLTVDKLIALSDHLDFFELIEVIKKVDPGMVYITHTPNPSVVQHYLSKENIPSIHLELETT